MTVNRSAVLVAAGLFLIAACGGPGASPAASPAGTTGTSPTDAPAASSPPAAADIQPAVCVGESTTYLDWLNGDFEPDEPDPIASPGDTTGDLLEAIQDAGVLRVSTDPNYAPQSFLEPDGDFVGFDIDVATAIAEGLGVAVQFETPDWEAITAGNWAGRWDISVGSMTITTPRKEILSFTQPYYYTPAFMAASTRSGITSLDDLPFKVPDDVTATTLTTDANCIESIEAGRPEFDLVITSETVIDEAVAADQPIVKIGEPIFVEHLAVAIDKSGPEHAALLYEIDRIIGEMHADGRLTDLSMEWFDADLTKAP